MGKKKNLTKHTASPTRDTSELADQESISTFSSDTASVPLDSTPLLALSPEVVGPAASHDVLTILNNIQTQLGAIQSRLSKLEGSNLPESKSHIPSVQDSDFPFKIQSSTVTTDSSKTLAAQVFSISEKQHHFETNEFPRIFDKLRDLKTDHGETRELFYNFKKDVKDYLGLDTSSRLHGSNLPSTAEDRDVPLTFRHVLEKNNKPSRSDPQPPFPNLLNLLYKMATLSWSRRSYLFIRLCSDFSSCVRHLSC